MVLEHLKVKVHQAYILEIVRFNTDNKLMSTKVGIQKVLSYIPDLAERYPSAVYRYVYELLGWGFMDEIDYKIDDRYSGCYVINKKGRRALRLWNDWFELMRKDMTMIVSKASQQVKMATEKLPDKYLLMDIEDKDV